MRIVDYYYIIIRPRVNLADLADLADPDFRP
jgi:hypothetical protein